MAVLEEAYVLGLLADVEREVPALRRDLAAAEARAAQVGAELSNLLRRLDEAKAAIRTTTTAIGKATITINDRNMRVAMLHQEIGALKRRADDIKTEMDRVGPGAIQRRLRRDRAKLGVQIEDREAEVAANRAEVDDLRAQVLQMEEGLAQHKDRVKTFIGELDQMQSQLPSPYAYTRLFDCTAARAHTRLFLSHDVAAWRREMATAIEYAQTLHRDLRAGKYRLDRNSDLVGGRATATAEALYAAVAIGAPDVARNLFDLVVDPSLFFHHIFNVFRVWCLGLFLRDNRRDLADLLRRHQYAEGLRGGYVLAYVGLLANDARRVTMGVERIVKHEWEMWQDPKLVRGAGVVNLGGAALLILAHQRGLSVSVSAPTIPAELLPKAPLSRGISRALPARR